ncbi:agmatinase [Yamadazyma tenuis]
MVHYKSIFGAISTAAALTVYTYDTSESQNEITNPQSFIDSLYGQLVHSPQSNEYKMSMMAAGEITFEDPKIVEFDLEHMELGEFVSKQAEIENAAKHQFAQKTHESYLKYQSAIKLPPDDDTEDIDGVRTLFGGIMTFGGLPHLNCFSKREDDLNSPVDIAIVGAPFDTAVSFRPGARFGPEGIRSGARRLGGATIVRSNGHSNTNLTKINPYDKRSHNLSIVDCGDVPLTPFDNRIALNQLYRGERAIHKHPSKNNQNKPKIITMGGDHTITLMALKSAYEQYGKLNVIHFDSHIDTWNPKVLGGGISHYMSLNHGTFLHYAAEQGYLNTSGCFHVGLRAPYIDAGYDENHDRDCGFKSITARDIDHLGIYGIVDKLLEHVGKVAPVYITVDIDVLDPAFAPATGTMEVGGWSSRELLSVLDGLEGINLVGADVVEVSPPFDSNSEITQLAATQVIDSYLGLMVVKEVS